MVVAVVTNTSLATSFTQGSLNTALQTAFYNAGYTTVVDTFTSGTDLCTVYKLVQDSTKTYGTTYLRIRVTTGFAIAQQIFSTWNSSTHTGTNASSELTNYTVSNSYPVTFMALNAVPEAGLVAVNNNGTFTILGIISPANMPTWWDLNQWNYGFIFTSYNFSSIQSTANNPYGTASYNYSLGVASMNGVNPINNRRDILTGITYFTNGNTGCAGRTSDDMGMAAVSGSTKGDSLAIIGTSQIFTVVNNVAGGLVMRIS